MLLIRLVYCVTKKLVSYEGTNSKLQSSELQIVLVTHRAICSRCVEGRVCGHKNETPTIPRALSSLMTPQLKILKLSTESLQSLQVKTGRLVVQLCAPTVHSLDYGFSWVSKLVPR